MFTVPPVRRALQPDRPPQQPVHVEVAWLLRPLWPAAHLPDGMSGLLALNGKTYMLTINADPYRDGEPPAVRGYRLTQPNGEVYDLPADCRGCSCGDATFRANRPGGCKHQQGLAKALDRIGYGPTRRPPFRSAGDMAANGPDAFADEFGGDAGPTAA